MMVEKTRVEWIDIFKSLGIIVFFCAHFGTGSGRLFDIAFYFAVQLFFFASGIFAGNIEKLSFKDAVKKRFGQIMIPYAFLAIINMGMLIITSGDDLRTYVMCVKQFVMGIRNQMPIGGALWFLPCIFCTGVLFDAIRRVCKKDVLVFLAAAALYFVSITLFPNRPDVQPSWFWNIDSACYYMIYYALGYIMRKKLTGGEERSGGESDALHDRKRRWLFYIAAVFLAGYAVSVYARQDIAGRLFLRVVPAADMIYPVLRGILLIIFNMILAKILEGFRFLSYAGTQTLWLCGNESIARGILGGAAELAGLRIEVTNELTAIIYAAVMMVVIITFLLPLEQRLYRKVIKT